MALWWITNTFRSQNEVRFKGRIVVSAEAGSTVIVYFFFFFFRHCSVVIKLVLLS